MEENVKNLWLDKIKSGKVAVIESHYAPKNNTNCIWLKDGQMYVYGNTGWELLGSGSGSGGGGGVIKLPVQFDTIEVTGDSSDSGGGERGNTKGPSSTTYYCKQKVSGDLFGPTENDIVLDLAYYFEDHGPKGGELKATKSDLDDIFHQYYVLVGNQPTSFEYSQSFLQAFGLTDDASAKVLMSWNTYDADSQSGPVVVSLIYKGSNYLYIVDNPNNIVLSQYYNNPDFRGITIMEDEEEEGGGDIPIVDAQ